MVTRTLCELCVVLTVCIVFVSGELFSSIVHLHSAVHAQKDLADIITSYVQLEEVRLTKLKRMAVEMRRHSAVALDDPDRYLTNPVDAFLFVKRHTLSWEREGEALLYEDNQVQDLKHKLLDRRQHLPGHEDLHGVTAALLRLQDTYSLDTHSIALGDLSGHNVSTLSINDCFDIGRLSFSGQDYYHAADWLSFTLDWFNKEVHEDLTFQKTHLLESLSFSAFMNGDVREALNFTNEFLAISPHDQKAFTNKVYYERILGDLPENDTRHDEKNGTSGVNTTQESLRHYKGFDEYEALCRGESDTIPVNKRPLKCRYRTRKPHFLFPVKEEEIHLEPWIVVYYDVISDAEIEILKDLSTPLLERAVVFSSTDTYGVPANYRISKSSWLSRDDDPLISALDARVDRFTGLNMDTAEALQVGNYGIGGHYEPHYDFAHTKESNTFDAEMGNRQATFMFYLSDVTAGGATVFPHIGVRVLPIKGAGVFWYNLRRSGEGLFKTWHAGCPVLVGTKWVANKWIHERGQESRKPCGLTVDE